MSPTAQSPQEEVGPKATVGHRMVRGLLLMLIGSLIAGGLFAVAILLFGTFGEAEGKIMGTTVLLGIFSFLGLASSLRVDRRRMVSLGVLGIIAAASAFTLSVVQIWAEIDSTQWGRTTMAVFVLAGAIAFASLLMLMEPATRSARWTLTTTFGLLLVLVGMLEYLALIAPKNVFEGGTEAEGFFRILGAVGILTALGAIVTPILNRVLRPHPTVQGADVSRSARGLV